MNLSSEEVSFPSQLGQHSFSRSNSLSAFDAIFGNDSLISSNDMFADLFGAEQAPEQFCDQFMHDKELNDVIEDLKQSIEGPVTTTPGPENFPEAGIQSAADFTGTLSPDTYPDSGFESQGTPVAVENIQYQDVVVAQAQPQQVFFDSSEPVVTEIASEKVVAILKQSGLQFDQIIIERRQDPARQNSPIQYEFQPPIEFPVKAEPEFPASPPTGTKRSRNDLDFTSAKKIKKEQNKNASKRYRDKKREEEKKLEDDLKFLENEKNRLDKELVTVQTTNKCRAEEMRRKFAGFIWALEFNLSPNICWEGWL